MNIWLVGDSVIRPAVEQFVADRGAQLIDTSVDECTPEHVWCEQVMDARVRNKAKKLNDLTVIVFINQQDYDSENTAYQVARRLPEVKEMYFLTFNGNERVLDGPTHEGDWIKVAALSSLNHATVLSKLQELYA